MIVVWTGFAGRLDLNYTREQERGVENDSSNVLVWIIESRVSFDEEGEDYARCTLKGEG